MSLVLTDGGGGGKLKPHSLRKHIAVWVLAELSASVLHSRSLGPLSDAAVFSPRSNAIWAVLTCLPGTD